MLAPQAKLKWDFQQTNFMQTFIPYIRTQTFMANKHYTIFSGNQPCQHWHKNQRFSD
jgi:hypothetical protein